MTATMMTKVREAKGLSMNELARRIGVPYPTVRIIDRGMGRGFSPLTKIKIAEELEADPLYLFPELGGIIDYLSGEGYTIASRTRKPKGRSHEKTATR